MQARQPIVSDASRADDFFRTLDHPFRPLPYLVDDFNATMNRLLPLAE
jgi:hypothetical protein